MEKSLPGRGEKKRIVRLPFRPRFCGSASAECCFFQNRHGFCVRCVLGGVCFIVLNINGPNGRFTFSVDKRNVCLKPNVNGR